MKAWMFLGAVLAVASATGAEMYGAKFSDSIELDGKTLVLNGLGPRKAIFGIRVYVAGLYLDAKSKDPEAIVSSETTKNLKLSFVRKVEAAKIRDAWSEGLGKSDNCGGDCASFKDRLTELNSWMSDMKEGSHMEFTFRTGGVEVWVNGARKGEVKGGDFGKALLRIWLGKDPPNEDLKKGLLGELKS